MSKQERRFEGVWIEKIIWLSKKLTLQEKVFFVEIKSLDNEDGCYATNDYFAKFFQISKRRCIDVIKSLESKGLIKKKLIYKRGTKQVEKRVLRVQKNWRKRLGNPGEENFTTPHEQSDTTPVKKASRPSCRNLHDPGEETCTDNTTINSTINSTVYSVGAHTHEDKKENKVETLPAEKVEDFSPQVAPVPPQPVQAKLSWIQVSKDMANWLKEDGADQWQFMCDSAGGYVEPSVITSAWAGKYSDSQYMLRRWKTEACKLQGWIKNELRSQKHNSKSKGSGIDRLSVNTYGRKGKEIQISKVPV